LPGEKDRRSATLCSDSCQDEKHKRFTRFYITWGRLLTPILFSSSYDYLADSHTFVFSSANYTFFTFLKALHCPVDQSTSLPRFCFNITPTRLVLRPFRLIMYTQALFLSVLVAIAEARYMHFTVVDGALLMDADSAKSKFPFLLSLPLQVAPRAKPKLLLGSRFRRFSVLPTHAQR
jgi:hypothetical protein